MKVVVFDDDAQVRQLYEAILEEGHYESATYPCDPSMVDVALRDDAPSLFIVSPVTGEDRGWQVVAALRRHQAAASVPILVGRVLREVPDSSLLPLSSVSWLPKEMDIDAVLAKIAETADARCEQDRQ